MREGATGAGRGRGEEWDGGAWLQVVIQLTFTVPHEEL